MSWDGKDTQAGVMGCSLKLMAVWTLDTVETWLLRKLTVTLNMTEANKSFHA
jgi:hypothetical protein